MSASNYPRQTTPDEGYLLLMSVCPACLHTPLLAGPRGGLNQDALCPQCHHEFCIGPAPVFSTWLGTANKDRLEWPYGIQEKPTCEHDKKSENF